MTLVVDASVVGRWFLPTPLERAAVELRREPDLIAPDFLLVEVANVLWKGIRRAEVDLPRARVDLDALQHGVPELVDSAVLLADALELAEQLDHPVYDCLYLALAVQEDTAVVTADRRLHERVVESEYAVRTRLLTDGPPQGGG